MTHIAIIGGSDAGVMAGIWAHRTSPDITTTLVVADHYPNFSICGIPFFVSGETPRYEMLAHRTADDLRHLGLDLLLGHTATAIDVDEHQLTVAAADGTNQQLDYDRLIIGTGARPRRPNVPGFDLPGVHVLHTIDEARTLRTLIDDGARRVAIVGAGYIGTELADAAAHRNLDVSLIEMAPAVMPTFDPALGALIGAELSAHGVDVHTATMVERIETAGDALRVIAGDTHITADAVVLALGVQPNVELATAVGAPTGAGGALVVDASMATGLTDVWAAGDCVHTHHVLFDEPTYLPLGTTAHKQGRVAGINAAGGSASYRGSLGTQAVKIIGKVAARTGLRLDEAMAAGFDAFEVGGTFDDHKAYYPGATDLVVSLVGDRASGRLLGAQLVGAYGAEVSKRVDIAAAAIHAGSSVTDLLDLDLSYTPPLSSPWDPVQTAAMAAWQP